MTKSQFSLFIVTIDIKYNINDWYSLCLVALEPGGGYTGTDGVVNEVADLRRLGVIAAVLQHAVKRHLRVDTPVTDLKPLDNVAQPVPRYYSEYDVHVH